jgi:hypothetical protein
MVQPELVQESLSLYSGFHQAQDESRPSVWLNVRTLRKAAIHANPQVSDPLHRGRP